MILGIGIDIVHISRMRQWQADEELLMRYFHPRELEEAKAKGPSFVQSLAARFAAKEAYGKALGTGLHNLRLKDIRISNDENGKPDLILYGSAKQRFTNIGGRAAFVSLTHERDNAIAVVVLEG
ncbi:MAG: holo-ACP synthase [Spirochaetales bacterium]|nr:holo-ACP synthase [Spirochaetales bacterium]